MGAEQHAYNKEEPPIPVNGDNMSHVSAHTSIHAADTELDDFGLPRKAPPASPTIESDHSSRADDDDAFHDAEDVQNHAVDREKRETPVGRPNGKADEEERSMETTTEMAIQAIEQPRSDTEPVPSSTHSDGPEFIISRGPSKVDDAPEKNGLPSPHLMKGPPTTPSQSREQSKDEKSHGLPEESRPVILNPTKNSTRRSGGTVGVSEWSHQRLAPQATESTNDSEEEDWKAMPALAEDEFDVYDDDGKLVARGAPVVDEEEAAYGGIGGAGKGYTRVQLDEDAQSATSLDDDTRYLFKGEQETDLHNDQDQRDALSQLQATKDLLTETQRVAYVGVTRLAVYNMIKELEAIEAPKDVKKLLSKATESMIKWGQQMMVRLYGHMDIDSPEQLMVEQLAEHGVLPKDLVPPLMQNSRVKNPVADENSPGKLESPESTSGNEDKSDSIIKAEPLPLQQDDGDQGVPEVQTPAQMTHDEKIDLDLRWTVLCDLFLVLVSDSMYDARSRLLLERVAEAMEISWLQICRFEKRVMDALEMQEEADKENWNEEEHMENRRKMGLKHKYMVMGLATVGGGLVIGLSAGLLAPVIGAGLAAGFTTIGVTGTAGFLGGIGGAALITSAATAAGGTIAVRASNRRTGAVRTFEYRPLHNNKRVNLILTVPGWMKGKVDDVRLPYSTVDPIMGDIYSLFWEPEMLQSMGDTINILATEALTQTVQQVLGSTILVALIASLQLPIVLTKLSYLIDNPWTVSLDRANSAGLILADSLIDRHLGNRPITLVGFSLGSRLIFSCLKELAARGAYGLIQNVYLFGSPVVAKKAEYLRVRSVVSGRLVNGYSSNDWILGYLFRATSGGIMRVAGLAPVQDVPGLENIDVTKTVNGHMAYRASMPKLLREVGWEVENDEFTEIEDPDPDNHDKRRRELIREIDEARKQAEEKPEKTRFGFFKRGRLAGKKGWGPSDESSPKNGERDGLEDAPNVLFDIEAIRRELESEMIEVRQLESTLPPMQISTKEKEKESCNDGADLTPTRPPPRPTKREISRWSVSLNGLKRLSSAGTPGSQSSPPPQLTEEEIKKLHLPPRPDEIDSDHDERPACINGPAAFTGTQLGSSSASPEQEFAFEAPKELKSTLPPLTLSPSLPQSASALGETSPESRPGLRSHATMPTDAGRNASSYLDLVPTPTKFGATVLHPPTKLSPGLSIEHNAWAEENEDFGGEREVKMSFE